MAEVAPNPGDFGLVAIQGTAGKLIRVGQWLAGDGFEPFEHVFVYVGDGQIVEAQPGGAVLSSVARYDSRVVRWSTDLIVPGDGDQIAQVARGFVGVPYSAADYFAIAAHRLHLWPADVMLKRYVASTRHMICSQLVDAAWRLAGEQLFADRRWAGYVTPGALSELLNAASREQTRSPHLSLGACRGTAE